MASNQAELEEIDSSDDQENSPEVGMKVVTFTLGEDVYGIDIMSLREIRVWAETTSLPNTPDFVMGVVNLRGVIVPVFDLRGRFGRGMTTPTKTHAVIIVAIDSRTVGILVDSVSDIIELNDDQIRPVPEMEHKQESAFLSGLATVNGQMVSMIATEPLFGKEAVNMLSFAPDNQSQAQPDS